MILGQTLTARLIICILLVSLTGHLSFADNSYMTEFAFSKYIIPFQSTSAYHNGGKIFKDLQELCLQRHGSMDLVNNYDEDHPVCVIAHELRWLDLRSHIPGNASDMCEFSDYRQYPPFDYHYDCGDRDNYQSDRGSIANVPNNFRYICHARDKTSVSISIEISPFRVSAFEGGTVGKVDYSILPHRCSAQRNSLLTKRRYQAADSLMFYFDNIKLTMNTQDLTGELEWPCVEEDTGKPSTPIKCEVVLPKL